MQSGLNKLLQVEHVIIYLKGNLLLLKKNKDAQFETIETVATPAKQEPYLLIKTISHNVVRLHMILEIYLNPNLAVESTSNLQQLRDQLLTLKNNYPHQVKSELPVIDLSLQVIDKLNNCVKRAQVDALSKQYLMEMEPHHERYGRQATEHQLRGLDQITTKWLALHAVNLQSTYIIIVGARGPKKGLIEMQYFKSLRGNHGLLDKNTSKNGTLYSEMLPEQMDVSIQILLDDLARDLVNQDIGERMLHNREAMNEDVLSRHGKSFLARVQRPALGAPLWLSFWRKQQSGENTKSQCPVHRSSDGN